MRNLVEVEILKNEPVIAELNKKIYNAEITKITEDINILTPTGAVFDSFRKH